MTTLENTFITSALAVNVGSRKGSLTINSSVKILNHYVVFPPGMLKCKCFREL